MSTATDDRFYVDVVREVWDNKTGERVEVGPDVDGLDLVEVRQFDDIGDVADRIVMDPQQALLVAQALESCARDLMPQKEA